MITLDALRVALLTANPYDGVDRLIRDELGRGRRTRDIHADLFPLVREVRRTPGITDDASEALLGALDALTGDCHPDCRYTDPPAPATAHPSANGNAVEALPPVRPSAG